MPIAPPNVLKFNLCQAGSGTGAVLWPAAAMLSKVMHRIHTIDLPGRFRHASDGAVECGEEWNGGVGGWSGRSVLELGCGLGLASLVAAYLGSPLVIATDGDESLLPVIRRNVDLNRAYIEDSPWRESTSPPPSDGEGEGNARALEPLEPPRTVAPHELYLGDPSANLVSAVQLRWGRKETRAFWASAEGQTMRGGGGTTESPGRRAGGPDCILLADLVYEQGIEVWKALVVTMVGLASETTVFLLAHTERYGKSTASFFRLLARHFYVVSLPVDDHGEGGGEAGSAQTTATTATTATRLYALMLRPLDD